MNATQHEYLMLREEILQYLKEYQDVRHMMYLVTATTLGFGLNPSNEPPDYLFLIPLIVIIPSYLISVDYWEGVVKAASYLQVFYEENPNSFFRWETRAQKVIKEYPYMSKVNYQHIPYVVCASACIILYFLQIDWSTINWCNLDWNIIPYGKIILGILNAIVCIIIFLKYKRANHDTFVAAWHKVKNREKPKRKRGK